MRTLTEDECRELVKSAGLRPAQLARPHWPVLRCKSQFLVWLDGHRPPASTVMAQRLASWLPSGQSCLVWIVEWGIWPSNENWPRFREFRRQAGDERELLEAPGHVLAANEKESLTSFIDLIIQFGWGAHILAERASLYMFVSHDEFVHVECRSGSDKARVRADLKRSTLRYQEE